CMVYGGVSVWVAAAMLCARAYRGRREVCRIVSMLVPGLVGLGLAFDAPPFDAVNSLPLFSSMWYFYHSSIAMFALAFLAAFSVERWFCRARHFRELLRPLPLLLRLVAILAYAYLFNATLMKMMKVAEYTATQCFYAACIAGAALLVFLLSCWVRRPRTLAFALTVLVAADLLFAIRDMYTPTPRSALFPETELTRALRAEGPLTRFEVLVATGITPGLLSIYELEEWEGYDGMYPARIWSLLSGLKKDAWISMEPVFGVTHYLHDPRMEDPPIPIDEPGRLEYVTRVDHTDLYRNPKAFKRAFLVGALQTTNDLDEMLAIMKREEFDPSKVALTDSKHGESRRLSERSNLGSADVTRRTFTRVTVEVKAEDACVLCLSEAYYPGWEVRSNGAQGEIIPVYHAFRGVILPKAGEYRVEFSYFPRSFIVGLAISVVAMILSCLYAFVLLSRNRCVRRTR
ncbi:MAG: YfhO family protein, partial [Candidatus Hydrogenedentes bacterium]|nr:YfhO family protein [Candidatus Hydrogenedentota bacterium]